MAVPDVLVTRPTNLSTKAGGTVMDSVAALTPVQQILLQIIYWYATNESNHGPITSWPTWDAVLAQFDKLEEFASSDINDAVATLPIISRHGHPYSPIWRSNPGSSEHIQPQEQVGLTLMGMDFIDPQTATVIVQFIAHCAEMEDSLPIDPEGVRHGEVDVNAHLGSKIRALPDRAGRAPLTDRALGELLMKEYSPLASQSTQFQYSVHLDGRRLRNFRGIASTAMYVRRLQELSRPESLHVSRPTIIEDNLSQERLPTVAIERRNTRPAVFIGSSTEGLRVANAIQVGLEHTFEATVWSQGIFEPGGTTVNSLIAAANNADFGIFVVDPDDTTQSRNKSLNTVRDNIVFELGLFMGALGVERCFMVFNRDNEPDIASDLKGITPATYVPRRDGNLTAALGAAVTTMTTAMNNLGPRASRSKEPRPFDPAPTGANHSSAMLSELHLVAKNADAQGWSCVQTATELRVENRKGKMFRLPIGEPAATRLRLRTFAIDLRGAGLRVSRAVCNPLDPTSAA